MSNKGADKISAHSNIDWKGVPRGVRLILTKRNCPNVENIFLQKGISFILIKRVKIDCYTCQNRLLYLLAKIYLLMQNNAIKSKELFFLEVDIR